MAMLASGLFFFAHLSLLTILPPYALNTGTDEAGWGMVVMITSAVACSMRVLGGSLSDRLGRKRVMIAGALACVLGSLLLYLTHDLLGLLIARAFHGISIGAFNPAYKALTIDLSPKEQRGEAIGLGSLTFPIGMILASPLGEWLGQAYGYQATFFFSTLMALLCVGVIVLTRERAFATTPRRSLIAGARAVFPLRSTQIGIWGMLSIAAMFAALFNFLPLLVAEKNLGGVGVGLAFSFYSIAQLLSQPLVGRLGDRIGWRPVIVPGMLLGSAGIYLLFLAPGPVVLYLGAVLIGMSIALVGVGLDAIVFNGAPDKLRGTATSLQYAGLDGWNGGLSWALGFIAVGAGYGATYALMAAIPLLWAMLMWLWIGYRRGFPHPLP